MKTLIRTGLMLIAFAIFSSACSSGLSITKRRYTKGYYVHHQGSPAETSAVRKERASKSKNVQEIPQEDYQGTVNGVPGDLANNEQTKTNPENALGKNHQTSTAMGFTTEMLVQDPIRTFKQLKKQMESSPAKEDALSLVWILILVLLAAYIAGLLLDTFGIGWVIHLLLVVILVLLILWLLRIV